MPKYYSNVKLNSLRQTPRKSAMAIDSDGYVVKGSVFDSRKLPNLSLFDKGLTANNTSGDGQRATNSTLTEEPLDSSYIDVKVNGVSYTVGDAVKTTSCYFSNDGGATAKSFTSSHPNGKISQGDSLYWNGSIAGFELVSNWEISIHYLRNDYNQLENQISALQEEVNKAQTNVNEITDSLAKVQAEYDAAVAAGDTALADKLQDEINDISGKLQGELDALNKIQSNLTDLENELEFGINYYQLIADAELLLLQKQSEFSDLTAKHKASVESYDLQIAQLTETIVQLNDTIAQLQASISDTEALIADKQAQLAEANAIGDTITAASLESEISTLVAQIEENEAVLAEAFQSVDVAQVELTEVQQVKAMEEDEFNVNISVLEKEIADLESQILEYQSNL